MKTRSIDIPEANSETLPGGGCIALYGTGKVGTRFLDWLAKHRPDVQCLFFIDSFKRDPESLPPVIHVEDLPERVRKINAVVIATCFVEQVVDTMERLPGLEDIPLLLVREAVPSCALPDSIIAALADVRHKADQCREEAIDAAELRRALIELEGHRAGAAPEIAEYVLTAPLKVNDPGNDELAAFLNDFAEESDRVREAVVKLVYYQERASDVIRLTRADVMKRPTYASVNVLVRSLFYSTRFIEARQTVDTCYSTAFSDPKLAENFFFPFFYQLKNRGGEREIPAIVVCNMHCSGTTFLRHLFSTCLGIPGIHAADHIQFSHDFSYLKHFLEYEANRGYWLNQEMPAEVLPMFLEHGIDSMVLHVRDPRQQILSLLHQHCRLLGQRIRPFYGKMLAFYPQDFLKLSLRQQIDMMIELELPNSIHFLTSWLDAKKRHPQNILLTSFEELLDDQMTFCDRLLKFFNVPETAFLRDKARTIRPEPGKYKLRKGEAEEWRTVFTEEQRQRVWAMLPESVINELKLRP